MFTGIVEEVGRLARIEVAAAESDSEGSPDERPVRVDITAARAVEGTSPGDSIAVNGVSLSLREGETLVLTPRAARVFVEA